MTDETKLRQNAIENEDTIMKGGRLYCKLNCIDSSVVITASCTQYQLGLQTALHQQLSFNHAAV